METLMENYYQLISEKRWDDFISVMKKTQQDGKKKFTALNAIEWERICSVFESEFIRYISEEKAILISEMCKKIIQHAAGGYITLTEKGQRTIEDMGIDALVEQESPELNAFARTCVLSEKAKNIIEDNKAKPRRASEKPSKIVRTDWLVPLFKSQLENVFYKALKEVYDQSFIYPNMALSNIFEKESIFPHLTREEQDYFFKAVVDFVVYDPDDGHLPKLFFEVDSHYHDNDKAIARDKKKDGIFEAANIELIRIRPVPGSRTPRSDFVKAIKENAKNKRL
tara:strand:- start:1773 stop:2618 length:846 start_codon:yes stop_codon:yes gene_type:complete